jgi:hypothetical protein
VQEGLSVVDIQDIEQADLLVDADTLAVRVVFRGVKTPMNWVLISRTVSAVLPTAPPPTYIYSIRPLSMYSLMAAEERAYLASLFCVEASG